MPAPSRSILFIIATIFIDAVGFGIVMPVLPGLLMRTGGLDLAGAIEIAAWIGVAALAVIATTPRALSARSYSAP